MANEVFISPGVFTKEIDKTTLAAGVAGIGPSFIGTAEKGPAFVPVTVSTFSEFQQIFGSKDPDNFTYLAYAAEAYLRNQSSLNIVRVLGDNDSTTAGDDLRAGFVDVANVKFLELTSGSTPIVAATFWLYGSATVSASFSGPGNAHSNFDLIFANIGPGGTDNLTASVCLDPAKSNYLGKVLNTDYLQFLENRYMLHDVYDYGIDGARTENSMAIIGTLATGTFANYNIPYITPTTPWVYSQRFGASAYKLFKIRAISDGSWANKNIKISVVNIKKSVNSNVTKFGSFGILVRKFDDTDKNSTVLESFSDLSLDPTSDNYVLRKIGDKYWEFDATNRKLVSRGDFSNKSKCIRVELSTDFVNGNVPEEALPWGFGKLPLIHSEVPEPNLTRRQYINNVYSTKKYYGILFEQRGSDLTAASPKHEPTVGNLLDYIPDNISGSTTPDELWFSLNSLSGSGAAGSIKLTSAQLQALVYDSTFTSATVDAIAGTTAAKFSFPIRNGFDGLNPFFNSPFYTWRIFEDGGSITYHSLVGGYDSTPTQESGSTPNVAPKNWDEATNEDLNYLIYSLRKGVELVSDPDFIDINILTVPGVTCGNVNNYGLTVTENRNDVLFIPDMFELPTPVDYTGDVFPSGSTPSMGALQIREELGYDSSYGATYFPWFKIYDETNKKYMWLPPTIAILSALSLTDNIAFSWSAPAGLTRGGLPEATEVAYRTNYSERNDLYDAGINPIAHFPREGIVIWGQKTLQVESSLLDRVNVRRLLLYARKTIASAVKYLVFEPNNSRTWERFVNLVNPILEYIQLNQGLTRFRVIADSSTTTPDLIDRNTMQGVIILQPTPAAEIIQIPFIITNEGAAFSE